MGAFIVVVIDPLVQIDLQLLDGLIDFLAEGDLIELLQDGLLKEPLRQQPIVLFAYVVGSAALTGEVDP